jgi:hypothetical protein
MEYNSLLKKESTTILLFLGVLTVSLGVILVAAGSQTIVVSVDRDLADYWRTSYDILVRPTGSRSFIEEKFGMVQTNHLAGIWGGISLEQYESIKGITDVEVAAPIAMIGYTDVLIPSKDLRFPVNSGMYMLEEIVSVDDGTNISIYPGYPKRSYFYFNQNSTGQPTHSNSVSDGHNIIVNSPRSTVHGAFPYPLFMAAIDPMQEAALLELDRTIVEGRYFHVNEPAIQLELANPELSAPELFKIPLLMNARNYLNISYGIVLNDIALPAEITSIEDITIRGGTDYLDQLAREPVDSFEETGTEMYQRFIRNRLLDLGMIPGGYLIPSVPTPLRYHESEGLPDYPGLVLKLQLPETNVDLPASWPLYRELSSIELQAHFVWNLLGIYDAERLLDGMDLNFVPLETYFRPISTLRYDEQGKPLNSRVLQPTGNYAGYIQSPPLLLTNLETATELLGEEPISAIRVRVGNIERLTSASQRKIEAIASEIIQLTELDVDITVGSSPTRVLVHIPGVGYVEEHWIQKNVASTYQERVQTGHLVLLGVLLAIGGLFVLDLAWAEVVAHHRMIALQKALGWRSSTIFTQVLGHLLLVSTLAASLGALAAWGITQLLGWESPPVRLLAGVPLLVVLLSLLGSLYPAWLAARVPPIAGLQQGSLRATAGDSTGRTFLPPRSLLLLAWRGLTRRWSRSALGGLTAMLSAGLLVLMLAVTVDRQGAISGTLLGEFILVRIESYHYAIVAIGFGLAALSLANSLLAGVLERRREIGVLKAVGWRTPTVARLFVLEGVLLGLLGGLGGAALGLATFVGVYETFSPSLGWITLVGVLTPAIVGALAALYPARVAARVLPAEAVRYE